MAFQNTAKRNLIKFKSRMKRVWIIESSCQITSSAHLRNLSLVIQPKVLRWDSRRNLKRKWPKRIGVIAKEIHQLSVSYWVKLKQKQLKTWLYIVSSRYLIHRLVELPSPKTITFMSRIPLIIIFKIMCKSI